MFQMAAKQYASEQMGYIADCNAIIEGFVIVKDAVAHILPCWHVAYYIHREDQWMIVHHYFGLEELRQLRIIPTNSEFDAICKWMNGYAFENSYVYGQGTVL